MCVSAARTLLSEAEAANERRLLVLTGDRDAGLEAAERILDALSLPLTGTTLGVNHFVWVVAAAASVALAPFAILLSFILRLGTVAKRTLSIGPFILRTTADDEAVASTPGTDEEDRDGGE